MYYVQATAPLRVVTEREPLFGKVNFFTPFYILTSTIRTIGGGAYDFSHRIVDMGLGSKVVNFERMNEHA